MEVILTRSVQHLGERGALVRVADGYARNYLLPQGMAILATPGARKQAEAMLRAEQRREAQRREGAMTRRDQIHGRTVTVRARANSAGKLFGSVSPRDICDAIRETHGIAVDPDTCQIDEPLRQVGEHAVSFRIYHDIAAVVTVNVKAIEGGAEESSPASSDESEGHGETRRAPRPKPIITDSAILDDEG